MKLIIGLGNPGDKYANHRSNIGFKILDVIANNNGIDIRIKKKKSLIGRGLLEESEVVLLKPQTFSELSGEAALYIASFLRIQPQDIIVIMDDVTLPLGKLVVDKGGEDHGHPAIANLAVALKSADFIRVRVGIANDAYENAKKQDRRKFVGQEFEPLENLQLINIINDAEAAIRSITQGDIEEVIEKFKV